MRVAIHDYTGHPSTFELSRFVAEHGAEVRHFYFAGDLGPKGDVRRGEGESPTFSIEAIDVDGTYAKGRMLQRRAKDIAYGRLLGARVGAFEPDIVLSANTPLEAQRELMKAVRRSEAAFVFWMQDFYSLAITRLLGPRWSGLGPIVGAWYRRLEKRQLEQSDAIIVISDAFRAELSAFHLDPRHIYFIPNWGPLSQVPVRPKVNPWSVEAGLADRFVFLYSGTLGLKHDPQLLIDLADACADIPDAVVVVAATGLGMESLRRTLRRRPRHNLIQMSLQSIAAFPDMLGAADVTLASLRATAGEVSVPSKILSYLCAARPIVISAPLENLAARVVADAAAGAVVQAGDHPGFVSAALALYRDADARAAAGANGRAYAEAKFEIGALAERFQEVFEDALARTRAAG